MCILEFKGLKKLKGFLFIVLPLVLIIGVLCGLEVCGSNIEKSTEIENVKMSSIKLNKTTLSLKVGKKAKILAIIRPFKATNRNVEWTTSNASIAEVDEKGYVTGKAEGIATITATTLDGGKTATCIVTVKTVPVNRISLNKTRLKIDKGNKYLLKTFISPYNSTNKIVTYISSDEKVAIVDDAGIITAIGEGKATIKATSNDGYKTAACTVTVKGEGSTGTTTCTTGGSTGTTTCTTGSSTGTPACTTGSCTGTTTCTTGSCTGTTTCTTGGCGGTTTCTTGSSTGTPTCTTGSGTGTPTCTTGGCTGTTPVIPTPTPGSNLALGKTVTQSSIEKAGCEGQNVVDGDASTRWASTIPTSSPEWVRVDLGQTQKINKVVINWEVAYANAYSIQVSNDGINFTNVLNVTNGTGGSEDVRTFNTVDARYVRIYCTGKGTEYAYSIYELEVYYGTGTSSPTPTPAPVPTPTPAPTPAPTNPASVKVYPGPIGVPQATDREVYVNDQKLFVYDTEVNFNRVWVYNPKLETTPVTYFDMGSGSVNIKVKVTGVSSINSVTVRPLALGIKPVVNNDTITFTLNKPAKLTIEVNNNVHRALHIFANPQEVNPPKEGDPNVLYYGPGVHNTGLVNVGSNQTVYIAGGAVVNGFFRTVNSTNVKFLGRGIIDASNFDRWTNPHNPIEISYSNSCVVDGICIFNSISWNIISLKSNNITINNVKIISCRECTDGIDLVSNKNTTITDCFIRTWDDGITIKGREGDVYNNIVDNVQVWTDHSRSCIVGPETGYEGYAPIMQDIYFKNITILHNFSMAPLAVMDTDNALMKNIHFNNVTVEDSQMCCEGEGDNSLINLQIIHEETSATTGKGNIRDVYFDNIQVLGGILPNSRIAGYDASATVENVYINNLRIFGKLITNLNDGRFQTNAYIRNINFTTN